ncbi:hypothetical protein ACNOYE_20695 [Nannocystaceae bacterium ST9]
MPSRRASVLPLTLAVLAACSGDDGRGADDGLTSQGESAEAGDEIESGDMATSGIKLDQAEGSETADTAEAETGECVAEMIVPEVESVGVDILVVVDTSFSMAAAIDAVQASINDDFAAILGASDIDYRVIVLGDYPPGEQYSICIEPPLAASGCDPASAIPAVTEVYKHYDAATGSGAFLASILTWYSTPDVHALAPGGYADFLREGTRKVILGMTDGTSASADPAEGDAFDAALLALPGGHFGTPGNRDYVFHAILEMPQNLPPTEPWLPDDPIAGQAASIQRVSVLSGGWRFPLALSGDFDVIFDEIAQDVVESTPLACEFAIPDPPEPLVIDPDTIQVIATIDGQEVVFHQVADLASCEPDAFYIAGESVVLCPDACALVQSTPDAEIDLSFGCDVGFVP